MPHGWSSRPTTIAGTAERRPAQWLVGSPASGSPSARGCPGSVPRAVSPPVRPATLVCSSAPDRAGAGPVRMWQRGAQQASRACRAATGQRVERQPAPCDAGRATTPRRLRARMPGSDRPAALRKLWAGRRMARAASPSVRPPGIGGAPQVGSGPRPGERGRAPRYPTMSTQSDEQLMLHRPLLGGGASLANSARDSRGRLPTASRSPAALRPWRGDHLPAASGVALQPPGEAARRRPAPVTAGENVGDLAAPTLCLARCRGGFGEFIPRAVSASCASAISASSSLRRAARIVVALMGRTPATDNARR